MFYSAVLLTSLLHHFQSLQISFFLLECFIWKSWDYTEHQIKYLFKKYVYFDDMYWNMEYEIIIFTYKLILNNDISKKCQDWYMYIVVRESLCLKITNLHLLDAIYHRIVIHLLKYSGSSFFNIFLSTSYTRRLKFLSLIFQIIPVWLGIFCSRLFCQLC